MLLVRWSRCRHSSYLDSTPLATTPSPTQETMNPYYRFTLCVDCPDGKRHVAALDVGAFAARSFEPYDLCGDPMTAYMAGGVTQDRAARIDEDRKQLAKEIATSLTKYILDAINGRDLRNGYEQQPKKP